MKLKRANYAIAVMVVATALCADRAAARDIASVPARPVAHPGIARTIANKLTSSFRVVVPAVRIQQIRSNDEVATPRLVVRETASGVRPQLSPFQFRLPPPAL